MNVRTRRTWAEVSAAICAVAISAASLFIAVRQNALMANVWRGLGAATACVVEDNRHHYNVIEGLSERDSPLTKALFEA